MNWVLFWIERRRYNKGYKWAKKNLFNQSKKNIIIMIENNKIIREVDPDSLFAQGVEQAIKDHIIMLDKEVRESVSHLLLV